MSLEEALMLIEAIPEKIWNQLSPSENAAIELIIKNAKLQIPQEPDYEGDGYWNGELVYDTWICRNCGTKYEVDYDNYDYCPKCGQLIDRR